MLQELTGKTSKSAWRLIDKRWKGAEVVAYERISWVEPGNVAGYPSISKSFSCFEGKLFNTGYHGAISCWMFLSDTCSSLFPFSKSKLTLMLSYD